jgi:hypothetical protein
VDVPYRSTMRGIFCRCAEARQEGLWTGVESPSWKRTVAYICPSIVTIMT